MPSHCVAADCKSVSGMGMDCSFHKFPGDDHEEICKKWIGAVKRQRVNWKGPSPSSQLCSEHFKADCFVTEGVLF